MFRVNNSGIPGPNPGPRARIRVPGLESGLPGPRYDLRLRLLAHKKDDIICPTFQTDYFGIFKELVPLEATPHHCQSVTATATVTVTATATVTAIFTVTD